MARRKTKSGKCCLCGKVGKLSFEHVPPEKAFNDNKVFHDNVNNMLRNHKLKISQRGVGDHTLCEPCNNDTGSMYGTAFVEFCKRAAEVLSQAYGYPALHYEYKTYPLRVIKQIVTMFFSTNGLEWRKSCPELEKFVLEKLQNNLPKRYRIFIYYNIEGSLLKHTGIQRVLEFDPEWIASPTLSKRSEIVHPPFGYLMTIDSDKPDDRLFDISWFSKFSYDEHRHVCLKITVLPIYTMYAGQYPSLKDMEEIRRKNPKPGIQDYLEDIVNKSVNTRRQ